MSLFVSRKAASCRSRWNAAVLSAALLVLLPALAGCGKGEDDGKLLSKDKLGVSTTEFLLARAHDFDRLCEALYLRVPLAKQLGDVAGEITPDIFAGADLRPTPTTIHRWDYVLLRNRHDPQAYESIFMGRWQPARAGAAQSAAGYALFVPLRCRVSKTEIALYVLEPPFIEQAGDGPSRRTAEIVAKYRRIAPGEGEPVEQLVGAIAADKPGAPEPAQLSVVVKESNEPQSGSSESRR